MLAKLLILGEIRKSDLEEYDLVVDKKNCAIANFPDFAGREDFDVPPTTIEVIAQRYNVMEVENRAVGFPYGNIDRVARV